MNFTAMSVLIIFIFCVTDALPRVFEKAALGKRKIIYFALCAGALHTFEPKFSPELTVNVSCIMILIVCAALEGHREGGKALDALPVIVFCAVPAAFYKLAVGESEILLLAVSFLTAAISLISGGLIFAFACSAAAPVFSEILKFIGEMGKYNYGTLEFTGNIADAQLIGLIFTAVLFELYLALKNFYMKRRKISDKNQIGKYNM